VREVAKAIVGGGTPSREIQSLWNGGIPWVTPGELTKLDDKYLHETAESISKAGLAHSGAKLLPASALIVTTRATLGLVALAAGSITTNQGFKSIVFSAEADPNFYYHLFKIMKPEMVRRASGTTFLEISGRQFGAIVVPLPPIREQRRIAEILDMLDDQIRATEQIIAKLILTRAGLTTHLLSRMGDLQEVSLDNYLQRIDAGWSPDCPEIVPEDGSWGVLKVSAVSGGLYRPSESKLLPSSLGPRPALEVKDGDVLCVRANGVGELVGRVAYVETTPNRLMLSDKTLRLVPTALLDGFFLSVLLGTSGARRQIEARMGGSSSQKNISQAQLRSLLVIVPDLTTQRHISAVVRNTDSVIGENERTLDKLRLTGFGIVADLLTGRVRVPIEVAS